ncbi:baseplate spike [Vibrio phage D81]
MEKENKADFSPFFDYVDAAIQDRFETVFTSLPGHIVEFNPPFAKVQPGIKRVHNSSGKIVKPPLIIEVPVVIYGGSDYYVEPEITPGTECMISFSQRIIDGWIQSGGVAEKVDERIMDENDAMCTPGLRSLANAPQGYANNGIRIRNKAGDQYFWLKNDSTGEIKVPNLTINAETVHNGNMTLNGNLTQTGNQDVTGNITASGTIKAAVINAMTSLLIKGLEMLGHKHGAVSKGKDVSGGPQ